jgi:hypothetical protein
MGICSTAMDGTMGCQGIEELLNSGVREGGGVGVGILSYHAILSRLLITAYYTLIFRRPHPPARYLHGRRSLYWRTAGPTLLRAPAHSVDRAFGCHATGLLALSTGSPRFPRASSGERSRPPAARKCTFCVANFRFRVTSMTNHTPNMKVTAASSTARTVVPRFEPQPPSASPMATVLIWVVLLVVAV